MSEIIYNDEYIETVYFGALTHVLKEKINAKYKSIKQFSDESGIPYMTIANVLKRGIANSSIATVFKICKAAKIPFKSILDDCKHLIPDDLAKFMEIAYGNQ